jgi:hypothetical protein
MAEQTPETPEPNEPVVFNIAEGHRRAAPSPSTPASRVPGQATFENPRTRPR